jgi:hypothetical protein
MKNRANEANVPLSKHDYETDSGLVNAIKKNKDNPLPVDDATYKKMLKSGSGTSDTSSSNRSTPPTTSTGSITTEAVPVDNVIEPQDQETIKYLSNVKDPDTGKISKPFVIADKNYQLVRGMKPNREVVLGVLCLDEKGPNGHKIHSVDHFEKTIAIPMREKYEKMKTMENESLNQDNDKEKFVDHLNLSDMNGYKHFFVNNNTGNVTSKFKSTNEMLKSGIALKEDEQYMDSKGLKRFRYEHYFKPTMNEVDGEEDGVEGTNVDKLKADVKKLTKLISNKFSTAISRIDKPIEQVEFLNAMAEMIGVPFNKLTSLINSFRDVASKQKAAEPTPVTSESKIVKKDALLESLGIKQTIIKVNKNKDERK